MATRYRGFVPKDGYENRLQPLFDVDSLARKQHFSVDGVGLHVHVDIDITSDDEGPGVSRHDNRHVTKSVLYYVHISP